MNTGGKDRNSACCLNQEIAHNKLPEEATAARDCDGMRSTALLVHAYFYCPARRYN
jgi:hypothetical protein